jgi:hypothetical protein
MTVAKLIEKLQQERQNAEVHIQVSEVMTEDEWEGDEDFVAGTPGHTFTIAAESHSYTLRWTKPVEVFDNNRELYT